MDNYAEFLARLDRAAASLKTRKTKHDHALWAVRAAAEQNQYGFDEWSARNSRIETFLTSKLAFQELTDLHAISANMLTVFQGRSERVNTRLAAVQTKSDQINRALHALELSRQKLVSSRKLAEERESLNQTMIGLTGTVGGPAAATPDGGLRDDLQTAKEAVVMAEALLEAKGD